MNLAQELKSLSNREMLKEYSLLEEHLKDVALEGKTSTTYWVKNLFEISNRLTSEGLTVLSTGEQTYGDLLHLKFEIMISW